MKDVLSNACRYGVPYLLALEEVLGWNFVSLYIIDCKDRQFTVIIEGGGVLGWILFAAGIESLCKD